MLSERQRDFYLDYDDPMLKIWTNLSRVLLSFLMSDMGAGDMGTPRKTTKTSSNPQVIPKKICLVFIYVSL
jgi:hypothetical protein